MKFYGYSLVFGKQFLGTYKNIKECRRYWKWQSIWDEDEENKPRNKNLFRLS